MVLFFNKQQGEKHNEKIDWFRCNSGRLCFGRVVVSKILEQNNKCTIREAESWQLVDYLNTVQMRFQLAR